MILLLKTKTENKNIVRVKNKSKKRAAPRYPENQTAAYKILVSNNDDFHVALYINFKKCFVKYHKKQLAKTK